MRRAANNDKNQPRIIGALRKLGITVEVIGKPLDLLINARFCCPHCSKEIAGGRTTLMEVKNPERTSADPESRLTKAQIEFIARWTGRIDIVRTEEDAIRAILGENVLA